MFAQFFWIRRVVKLGVKKVKRPIIWNGRSNYYLGQSIIFKTTITLFCWLRLVPGAGLLWEKITAGWLVAGAGLVWEENTVGWLEKQPAEQSICKLSIFCICYLFSVDYYAQIYGWSPATSRCYSEGTTARKWLRKRDFAILLFWIATSCEIRWFTQPIY